MVAKYRDNLRLIGIRFLLRLKRTFLNHNGDFIPLNLNYFKAVWRLHIEWKKIYSNQEWNIFST